jgi:uncharacterized protein
MNTSPFALITGASSGIGKAIAFELASRKKNLLLVALPNTGLKKIAQDLCTNHAILVHSLEVDLTEEHATENVYQWCIRNHYPVDVLINNAGFGNLSALEKTVSEEIITMINLNSKALALMTHRFIPLLKRHPRAYLLNVGSLASFMPVPNKSIYAATKSFVYAFSYSLRLELMSTGISVSCLCPGSTITGTNASEIIKRTKVNKSFIQLPEEVASIAVRELLRGTFRIIPGSHNLIFYRLRQWLPEILVIWILQRVFNHHAIKPKQQSLTDSTLSSIRKCA